MVAPSFYNLSHSNPDRRVHRAEHSNQFKQGNPTRVPKSLDPEVQRQESGAEVLPVARGYVPVRMPAC